MRVLNLANPAKGNIEYTVLSFPDGQQLINLGGFYGKGNTNVESTAQIVSRMGWADVQLIMCAATSLREAGFKHIHLYVPYFLGARSDRKFQPGSVNYLKEVICPLINSMNFDSVTVTDPHSHCLEMGLKNFKKNQCHALIHRALIDLDTHPARLEDSYHKTADDRHYDDRIFKKLLLVGPDKGSYDRVADIAKLLNTDKVVMCDKHRDIITGKILSIDVPEYDMKDMDVIIPDDICDGGGTFIPIATECKRRGAKSVRLVVTHGIFSKGLKGFSMHFDGIYTTNSIREFSNISDDFVMHNDKQMHKLHCVNII